MFSLNKALLTDAKLSKLLTQDSKHYKYVTTYLYKTIRKVLLS